MTITIIKIDSCFFKWKSSFEDKTFRIKPKHYTDYLTDIF